MGLEFAISMPNKFTKLDRHSGVGTTEYLHEFEVECEVLPDGSTARIMMMEIAV